MESPCSSRSPIPTRAQGWRPRGGLNGNRPNEYPAPIQYSAWHRTAPIQYQPNEHSNGHGLLTRNASRARPVLVMLPVKRNRATPTLSTLLPIPSQYPSNTHSVPSHFQLINSCRQCAASVHLVPIQYPCRAHPVPFQRQTRSHAAPIPTHPVHVQHSSTGHPIQMQSNFSNDPVSIQLPSIADPEPLQWPVATSQLEPSAQPTNTHSLQAPSYSTRCANLSIQSPFCQIHFSFGAEQVSTLFR